MTGKILAESFIEIVYKTAGVTLDLLPGGTDTGLYKVTGMMSLGGKDGGVVFVSANEPSMRIFCSLMTGTPEDGVTPDDINDAVCELVNMTSGSAKLRLGNGDCALSAPLAIEGEGVKLTAKKRAEVITMLLGNGELLFKIIFYRI